MSRPASPLLWVLPAAFVAVLFAMRASSLPFWQSFNIDPDYYYLFNALRLIEMQRIIDIGHPGTPMHVLVALVVRLMHPGLSPAAVVEAVIADPERPLVMVTTVLYPMIGLGLWWMGRAVLGATGRIAPALLAQSAPFLSMIVPKYALHPKPEALLVIAACWVVVAALSAATAPRLEDRHAKWLGVAVGFGIACKLQFAAMGLVPLFLLDRRRLLVILPMATVAGFVFFVAPALPSWDLFLDWWGKVLTHSGAYGSGDATVVEGAALKNRLAGLFGAKPLTTAVMGLSMLGLAGYFRLRRRGLIEPQPMARLLAGMVLAQLATILITAKQPAAHYLLPALMLTGPSLAALWVLSARVFPARPHRIAWAVIAVVLLAAQGHATWKQNAELAEWSRGAQALDEGRFAACAKVDYDQASSVTYAMERGNMDAGGTYGERLAPHWPKDRYTWFTNEHSFWHKGFWQAGRQLDPAAELAKYPCLLFRGTTLWTLYPELERLAPQVGPLERCMYGEEYVLTKGASCKLP
ncbi:MAG: hypothetical protein ACM31L_08320 [Actinomycetota bacterium]